MLIGGAGPLMLCILCTRRCCRRQQVAWRQEDRVQRELENARELWARYVERNRCRPARCCASVLTCCCPSHSPSPPASTPVALGPSAEPHTTGPVPTRPRPPLHAAAAAPPCRREVEERAEQLKAISNLSALIAGFVLVSFLQFGFDPGAATQGVQLAFGITIALTVRCGRVVVWCGGEGVVLWCVGKGAGQRATPAPLRCT